MFYTSTVNMWGYTLAVVICAIACIATAFVKMPKDPPKKGEKIQTHYKVQK